MKKIHECDVSEFTGEMIDMLEDYLESKNVTPEMLPNAERDKDYDDNAAIIYGNDYDDIATTIYDQLRKFNLIKYTEGEKSIDLTENDMNNMVNEIYKSMEELMQRIINFKTEKTDEKEIKEKVIKSTFAEWNRCDN